MFFFEFRCQLTNGFTAERNRIWLLCLRIFPEETHLSQIHLLFNFLSCFSAIRSDPSSSNVSFVAIIEKLSCMCAVVVGAQSWSVYFLELLYGRLIVLSVSYSAALLSLSFVCTYYWWLIRSEIIIEAKQWKNKRLQSKICKNLFLLFVPLEKIWKKIPKGNFNCGKVNERDKNELMLAVKKIHGIYHWN